jgi:transcriptional regulator with XRE-family HTH domain
MDIDTFNKNNIATALLNLAQRVKQRRLEMNLTQRNFAKRAGVGYDAYRRFESNGEINLRNLMLCAMVLDELDAFNELFTQVKYQSIHDVIDEKKAKKRKRATDK